MAVFALVRLVNVEA